MEDAAVFFEVSQEHSVTADFDALVDLVLVRARASRGFRRGLVRLDRFVSCCGMGIEYDNDNGNAAWKEGAWHCRQQWDRVVFCGRMKLEKKGDGEGTNVEDAFLGTKLVRISSVGECAAAVAAMLVRRRKKEEEEGVGSEAGTRNLLVYGGSEDGRRVLLAVAMCWLQMFYGMSPLAAAQVVEEKWFRD